MTLITLFNQIAILFALILSGYAARRLNILDSSLNRGISRLILQITLPALIIKSMQFSFSREVMLGSIKIIILSVVAHFIAIAIAYFSTKTLGYKGAEEKVFRFILIFSNVGYMGYPIIKVIYGDLGVFYTALFNIVFNVLLWTLGVALMTNEENMSFKGSDLKKILINPGILAVILGFSLFALSIKLHFIIYETLNLLGETTVPLSMIIIGSMLAEVPIKEIFSDRRLFIISFIRLLVIPIVVWLGLHTIGLRGILLGIPVLVMAMPAAANTAIFSAIYDTEPHLASKGVFITTLLSMMTIPLIAALL